MEFTIDGLGSKFYWDDRYEEIKILICNSTLGKDFPTGIIMKSILKKEETWICYFSVYGKLININSPKIDVENLDHTCDNLKIISEKEAKKQVENVIEKSIKYFRKNNYKDLQKCMNMLLKDLIK